MAGTGDKLDSLRPNRFQGERILLALAISIFVHVLIWGGYELNRDMHWTRHLPWSTSKPLPLRIVQVEEPLEFVTVNNPSTEAPQNTKYYSNHNSVAANPEVSKITDQPKISGKQMDAPATETIVEHQFSKSTTGDGQHEQGSSQAQPAPNARPEASAGDLTLGKPNTQEEQPRPRTLKQAYEQMRNRMPQMAMNEDGGVQHRAEISSFDVRLTGFGDYDARFFDAIDQNWINLLNSHRFAEDRTGKVRLVFQLNYDGTISQMRIEGNNVGDLLGYVCEKAILDGAPYESWTEDMRLKLGDSQQIIITFVYE
jgi:hypothetical protein